MSDPVLRELTASEPLTLDEEYSMQSEFPYHKLYQLGKASLQNVNRNSIHREMAG
jgi:hypothetical protein